MKPEACARALCLGAALALATEPTAAQTTAPAPTPPAAAPVVVDQDVPRGSSGQVATGAALGVLAGVLVLILVLSTASVD